MHRRIAQRSDLRRIGVDGHIHHMHAVAIPWAVKALHLVRPRANRLAETPCDVLNGDAFISVRAVDNVTGLDGQAAPRSNP